MQTDFLVSNARTTNGVFHLVLALLIHIIPASEVETCTQVTPYQIPHFIDPSQ